MTAASDPAAVRSRLMELLAKLSEVYQGAEGWTAQFHFEVAQIGDFGFTVTEKTCTAMPEPPPTPSCTVRVGPQDLAAILQGELKPQLAVMTGRLKTNNMNDLMKLATRFDFASLRGTVELPLLQPAATPPEPEAAAEAPPKTKGPDLSTPKGRIDYLFQRIPDAFVAQAAGSWATALHFAIGGAGDYQIVVKEGGCTSGPGQADAPSCVIQIDAAETLLGMVDGSVEPQQAFLTGKIKANNMGELMKFGQVFKLRSLQQELLAPPPEPEAAAEPPPKVEGPDLSTPKGRIDYLFQRIPDAFVAQAAGSWATALHFAIGGAGDYQIVVEEGGCTSGPGQPDAPSCVIQIDAAETLLGMVDGSVEPQQAFLTGKIKANNMGELMKFGQVFKLRSLQQELLAPPPEPEAPVETRAPVQEKPTSPLDRLFARLPGLYEPDPRFVASIVFRGDGVSTHTLTVQGRSCQVAAGEAKGSTCTIHADADTMTELLAGSLDRIAAMREGKLRTDHVSTLVRFCRSFPPPAGELNRELEGRFYRGEAVFAREQEMVAFAEATNDHNPWYVDRDRPGGIVAPPVFVMRLAGGVMIPLFSDPELRLDLTMMVHSEQDMRFHRPIRPWDLICPRANLTGIEDKSTGQLFRVHQRYYCEGELAVAVMSSLFVRSRHRRKKKERPRPPTPERKVLFMDVIEVAEDQSIRYGHASGDVNPIHMDDEAARMAGLPKKILHGLCTMSFCGSAIIQNALGGNPTGLKRLKARFSHYVLGGDTITTSFWLEGEQERVTTIGFETTNQDGKRVLTEGLAEISRGR